MRGFAALVLLSVSATVVGAPVAVGMQGGKNYVAKFKEDNLYLPEALDDRNKLITGDPADIVISKATGDFDRAPAFRALPLLSEASALYPTEALRFGGVDGRVTLRCRVNQSGSVHRCEVLSENPLGRGFGKAAVSLAGIFRLAPAMKEGRPTASTAEFVIGFRGPGKPLGSHIGRSLPASVNEVVTKINWREAPTYDQVVAVYPEAAKAQKVSGQVLLKCVFNAEGRLRPCDIHSQTPAGFGFGRAAQRLTSLFVSAPHFQDGSSVDGASISIPVSFQAEMLERRDAMGELAWEMSPSAVTLASHFPIDAEEAGITKGEAVLECRVGVTGRLDACSTISEEPKGVGFGEAAVVASRRYLAPKWTGEGVAAVGATVRFPITMDLYAGAQAAR